MAGSGRSPPWTRIFPHCFMPETGWNRGAILEAALFEGKIVLADRYVASNLAHQSARVAPEKREEFVRWLKRLEYEIYALPEEDLVIYLRLSAAEATARGDQKAARGYTAMST